MKPLVLIACILSVLYMSSASEPVQKAIVLQNMEAKHMGFMLTHLKPTAKHGEYQGECVFMLLPRDPELIETKLGVLISELKVAGEHACRMSVITNETRVVVSPRSLPELVLVIRKDGKGTLSKREHGVDTQIGLAEFAKKDEKGEPEH